MLYYLTLIVNWVTAHKDALLTLVGGSTGLAVLAQSVLHRIKVKWGVDSKVFSYTLVQALTLIAALSAYLVSNANFSLTYPWLATIVAVVHRYMVSPYYTSKILPYLEFQASQEQAVTTPTSPTVPAAQEAPISTPAPAEFV